MTSKYHITILLVFIFNVFIYSQVKVALFEVHSEVTTISNKVLTDLVANEFSKYSGFSTLSWNICKSILNLNSKSKCNTDSCLFVYGQKLKVDYLLYGKLYRFNILNLFNDNSSNTFSLTLLDIHQKKIITNFEETISDNDLIAFNTLLVLVHKFINKSEPLIQEADSLKSKNRKEIEGMVWINRGKFLMGARNSYEKDEKPIHTVILNGFYMDITEVTIKEYMDCVKVGKCALPVWLKEKDPFHIKTGANRTFFSRLGMAEKNHNYPIAGVTWIQAKIYCQSRGKRLPTEAEWEYAARGGTSSVFPFKDMKKSKDYAWYDRNAQGKVHPVKQKLPNSYGLHDMLGNVNEWCSDFYQSDYYSHSPEYNPENTQFANFKVARGGDWNDQIKALRCANRNGFNPGLGISGIGFRCVKSP